MLPTSKFIPFVAVTKLPALDRPPAVLGAKSGPGDSFVKSAGSKEARDPKATQSPGATVAGKTKSKDKGKKPSGSSKSSKGSKGSKGSKKLASFAVQPKKGMKQQGKKGKYKQKEGGRQRTPWSGTLKRIRRILRGQLTPAQAISSIFSSPSMMMASVFLEANPKDLAMPCLSDEFRQRMDQQYLDSTQTFRLYQPPARPLESAPDNLIASTHQDYLLAN